MWRQANMLQQQVSYVVIRVATSTIHPPSHREEGRRGVWSSCKQHSHEQDVDISRNINDIVIQYVYNTSYHTSPVSKGGGMRYVCKQLLYAQEIGVSRMATRPSGLLELRVGKNIGQPADIKDNRGVTYLCGVRPPCCCCRCPTLS